MGGTVQCRAELSALYGMSLLFGKTSDQLWLFRVGSQGDIFSNTNPVSQKEHSQECVLPTVESENLGFLAESKTLGPS